MSIYGEGLYRCPTDGRRGSARAAARGAARRAATGSCAVPRAARRSSRCRRPSRSRCSRPRSTRSASATTRRCSSPGAAPTASRRPRCGSSTSTGPARRSPTPTPASAAIFASRLLNGRPPVIFEDGGQSRDFVHVSDIAAGDRGGARPGRADGAALNLGTGRGVSVLEVAAVLSRGPRRRDRAGDPRRLPRRRHPPLLRLDRPRPRAARLRAAGQVRGGHGRARPAGSPARAPSTASTRRPPRCGHVASPAEP